MKKNTKGGIILTIVIVLIFVLGGFIFSKSPIRESIRLSRRLSYEVTYGEDGRAYLNAQLFDMCQEYMKKNDPIQEEKRIHGDLEPTISKCWDIWGNTQLILDTKTRNAYIKIDGKMYSIGCVDLESQVLGEEYILSEEYYTYNESTYTIYGDNVLKWHLGESEIIPIGIEQCKIVASIDNKTETDKDLLLYDGENYYLLNYRNIKRVSQKATPQFVISGKALIWISSDMSLKVTNLLTGEISTKAETVYNVEKIEETICYYTSDGKKEWNYFIDLDGKIYEP